MNNANSYSAKELAERLQKLAIGTPYGLCPELIDAAIKAAEMLAWSGGPVDKPEVRLDDAKALDEVVAPGFHLERMDRNHWFLEIESGGKAIAVWLVARGNIAASYEHRDCSSAATESRSKE